MIVPDVNVLVHSIERSLPQHQTTRAWWDELLSSSTPVGLCLPVISGLVRLTTHRKVFARPLTVGEAIERVDGWLDQPFVALLQPSAEHWHIMSRLMQAVGLGGDLVTDIEIAAYALEHNAQVATNDADFNRFDGVSLLNPTL